MCTIISSRAFAFRYFWNTALLTEETSRPIDVGNIFTSLKIKTSRSKIDKNVMPRRGLKITGHDGRNRGEIRLENRRWGKIFRPESPGRQASSADGRLPTWTALGEATLTGRHRS